MPIMLIFLTLTLNLPAKVLPHSVHLDEKLHLPPPPSVSVQDFDGKFEVPLPTIWCSWSYFYGWEVTGLNPFTSESSVSCYYEKSCTILQGNEPIWNILLKNMMYWRIINVRFYASIRSGFQNIIHVGIIYFAWISCTDLFNDLGISFPYPCVSNLYVGIIQYPFIFYLYTFSVQPFLNGK